MSLAVVSRESELEKLAKSNDLAELNTLVLVGGHALYVGPNPDSEDSWRGGFPGEGKYYREHADKAVKIAAAIPEALLIFSGGPTRKNSTISEAQSYFNLQEQLGWHGHYDVRERTATEECARDSLENLSFSRSRFFFLTGSQPDYIVVVGWEFKRERFTLHAETLGIEIEYIGINNPPGDSYDMKSPLARAIENEKKTVEEFMNCPLGNSGELLRKKEARNPHGIIALPEYYLNNKQRSLDSFREHKTRKFC